MKFIDQFFFHFSLFLFHIQLNDLSTEIVIELPIEANWDEGKRKKTHQFKIVLSLINHLK